MVKELEYAQTWLLNSLKNAKSSGRSWVKVKGFKPRLIPLPSSNQLNPLVGASSGSGTSFGLPRMEGFEPRKRKHEIMQH